MVPGFVTARWGNAMSKSVAGVRRAVRPPSPRVAAILRPRRPTAPPVAMARHALQPRRACRARARAARVQPAVASRRPPPSAGSFAPSCCVRSIPRSTVTTNPLSDWCQHAYSRQKPREKNHPAKKFPALKQGTRTPPAGILSGILRAHAAATPNLELGAA